MGISFLFSTGTFFTTLFYQSNYSCIQFQQRFKSKVKDNYISDNFIFIFYIIKFSIIDSNSYFYVKCLTKQQNCCSHDPSVFNERHWEQDRIYMAYNKLKLKRQHKFNQQSPKLCIIFADQKYLIKMFSW